MSVIEKPYSNTEEWLSASSHGIGVIVACIGWFYLVDKVDGWYHFLVCTLYGLSMVLMFLSSTLYHAASNPAQKAKLKLIDHSAIYLLIAGTYTPFMLITLGGMLGGIASLSIWAIAMIGVVFKIFYRHRFPKLSLLTYLLMGWLALGFIYPLYQNLSPQGFWLLIAGGGCYTLGVGFYVAKTVPYTHAIWHLFVAAGCTCHYLAIYQNV